MEQISIGSRIASLRKKAGMTQRELAQRLFVSDKTVSRWERNDGTPDISLIPAIAEIFNVTCDELLCGKTKETGGDDPRDDSFSLQAWEHLLKRAMQRYRAQSLIAVGISCAGVMCGMIANFGFLRGRIGGFLGLGFFVAAVICQWIFTDHAALHVAGTSDVSGLVTDYCWKVFRTASVAFSACIILMMSTLPMLFTADAYAGMPLKILLPIMLIGQFVLLIICYVVVSLIRNRLIDRGVLKVSFERGEALGYNLMILRKIVKACAVAVTVTAIVHGLCNNFNNAWDIADGRMFTDYESFVAFMETPEEGPWHHGAATVRVPDYLTPEEETEWLESHRRTLTLADGTVVCSYLHLNEMVERISYSETDGDLLPIRVVTYHDVETAHRWVQLRNFVFCLLYGIELALSIFLYFRLRRA